MQAIQIQRAGSGAASSTSEFGFNEALAGEDKISRGRFMTVAWASTRGAVAMTRIFNLGVAEEANPLRLTIP